MTIWTDYPTGVKRKMDKVSYFSNDRIARALMSDIAVLPVMWPISSGCR